VPPDPDSPGRPFVSVDVVALTVVDGAAKVLLVRRSRPPFAGAWALPGALLLPHERLAAGAHRALAERSGLAVAHLEQLYTFDEPRRDPRERALSVAHVALLPLGQEPPLVAGRDTSAAAWVPMSDVLAGGGAGHLGFDHAAITRYAIARVADKLHWTPLVFHVVPPQFTLAQLREVFDAFGAFADVHSEGTNFLRLVTARWPIEALAGQRVAPVPGRRGRPAQLFRYAGDPTVAGPPPAQS
jgi:8-oxo-dGTP diphosphatase